MEPVSTITHRSVPKTVYSWFDPVILAKVLTDIHERAGFPGFEELFSASCQWLSCNAFNLGHFWYPHCIPWPWKCGFAILLTFWITSLCVFALMSAILENGAVCESHAFPTMSSHSFVIPHPNDWFQTCRQMLVFGYRYLPLLGPLLQQYHIIRWQNMHLCQSELHFTHVKWHLCS